ncbi:hypothetical protein SAMN05880561_103213 [Rhizobium sp. RU33A]|uniref:hypothetical protein n=1 Tax=Rhizobium sp. RU33A TaxID=1907413 RepID=UPI00095509D8|nr:hypothetical protein [Rhizobium sp. RU33A]SIQ49740.1 hypothetical protein SAMN05880561_103213 [Rhizobium sp. RU33A]
MTDAGHEDRMLLALDPAALVTEPEPAVEERARVPRSRNASYGRIIDHFLTKLEIFDDELDGLEIAPMAARLYQDV